MKKNRSTPDLVVIILTIVVSVVVLVSVTGLVVLEIVRPEAEIGPVATRLGGIVSSMIGVIVGYIAGRGSDKPDG